MNPIGCADNPLRVAIVGAGPAGFYAAEQLLKQTAWVVGVDMFDKLPTPYGLVRSGVAPDHQKIKEVTKLYEKTAVRPGFRFFGNVELGKHLTVSDLTHHYHQIIYATGAQSDRPLDIPGIDLQNSHAATDFVAWYNGHPDYRHLQFDLSHERVAVIGVGNVALDVARILCRTPEELAATDIADYALAALSRSRVKEVVLLGRRGPAQVAFTPSEVRELDGLADADIHLLPEELVLDPISAASLAEKGMRPAQQMVDTFRVYAARGLAGKARRMSLRFLVSPTALCDFGTGRVQAMRVVKNELVPTATGRLQAKPTQLVEVWPVGLVFRSIGYHGVALPGVPFREDWGIIPNEAGRVVDPMTNEPLLGMYTTGWIRRGPSGVIGTNKADAVEVVAGMLADVENGRFLSPAQPSPAAALALVRCRQPTYFTFADWQRLDALEQAKGAEQGRPRVKFTSVEEITAVLPDFPH